MSIGYRFLRCLFLFLIPASAAMGLPKDVAKTDQVQIRLVSKTKTILPGDTLNLALEFKLSPEWHLYWTNPGDAGLAPKIKWRLPEGFESLAPELPIPKRIPAGPLVSFGYDKELVILAKIVSPQDLTQSSPIEITAEVDWLVCKVECIPQEAVVSLSLPTSSSPDPIDKDLVAIFQDSRDKLARQDSDWLVRASASPDEISIVATFHGKSNPQFPINPVFFPNEKGIIENAASQAYRPSDDGFTLTIARNKLNQDTLTSISGIIAGDNYWILGGSTRGLLFDAKVDPVQSAPVFVASTISWWQAILFAFIGGVILNLMPCVLPVLSIKVLGFVQQAHNSNRHLLLYNSLFTFGVLMSFWILALILVLLRAGGEELGWGFQLQSPEFLIALTGFIFLVGLNLLGVFEVGTGLTGLGAGSNRSGALGSFISGVTTTIVATPCTAPFMGSALGFSLSQPVPIALLIFTALGLGTAAPFVLLTSSPMLFRLVPKPGRWMETLKHIMGFLMLATVVWLAWVLVIQAGVDSVPILLASIVLLAIAAWIFGRWGNLRQAIRTRRTARISSAALALLTLFVAMSNVNSHDESAVAADSRNALSWEPFTPERVAEVQKLGKPILIDFTAAWCLSCKVNERVALNSSDVRERISKLEVVTFKADWTTRDSRITQALAQFGRNSVPLYVLYTGREGETPIVLPEILTPGIVLEALDKIEG